MMLNLPIGIRTINVRAFGWEDASCTVNVSEYFSTTASVTLRPAAFTVSGAAASRRRFNPSNPGSLGLTEFRFYATAPGKGVLRIQNQSGEEVYSASLGPFDDWLQKAAWDGRDIFDELLPEGKYKAIITAIPIFTEPEEEPKKIYAETQIDYSLIIFPLALSGGVPGLLFTPAPATLPTGSFQIEAVLLIGSFMASEPPPLSVVSTVSPNKIAIPFEVGLRFSPLDRFELAAAFNANMGSKDGAGYGFTASAKYAFFRRGNSFPVSMAAAISWVFGSDGANKVGGANEVGDGEALLGGGKGGALQFPMSLGLNSFSLYLSPGVRWPGKDDPIPRLVLSAGALYRSTWFTTGISVRPEFDFTRIGNRAALSFGERVKILCGAECKFYPPPSNIVYSVLGGVWIKGGRAGGFSGIGIGLLY